MREVGILVRRELRSYFASPIAYVFGILFLLVMGYLSVQSMLVHGQMASMQAFFTLLPWIFLFFLPALSMRSWAEERKLGTLELLMTFPISVPQMIAGKFFAALAFLAMVMSLTIGLPITLAVYGDLDVGPVISAYLASFLMAASFIAVGMFCSSVTRDQIVALLLSLVSLLALFLVGSPAVQLSLSGAFPEWLVGIIAATSPYQYFGSISRGVLDTRDLVFYACFCGCFLYLNGMVLQGRRMKG